MGRSVWINRFRRGLLPIVPRRALEAIKFLKHSTGLFHPLGCRLVERPPGKRVLVLAAHPDDEVLGCGGTLRKHVLAGERVVGLYLTDGAGTYGGSDLAEEEKRLLIESQACRAGSILGLERQVFCRQRSLRASDSLEQSSQYFGRKNWISFTCLLLWTNTVITERSIACCCDCWTRWTG